MASPAGGGGGGGRSFPVYLDLITRGADQAIAGLRGAATAMQTFQTGAQGASKAVEQIDTTMVGMGRSAQGAAAGLQQTGTAAKLTSQGLNAGVQGANQFTAGLKTVQQSGNAVSSSMTQATASINKLGVGTSRARTGLAALRQAGKGAQFAIIGLVGSVNEAIFMIQSYAEAQQKVGAAQAEVDRIMAEGGQNTAEYTSAVKDLQDAQRGAQFTSRIMAQSILDNVTFGGMLLSQLPKVISKYRELRQQATGTASVMGAQGGIFARLRTAMANLVSGANLVTPSFKSAESTIKTFGDTATKTGGAVIGTGNQIRTLGSALPTVASASQTAARSITSFGTSATQTGGAIIGTAGSIGRIGPALAQMTASTSAAAASTLPLAAGMKLVDRTSKSLVPGNLRMAESTAAMIPANVGAAGSFGVLAGAMRAFGQSSFNFVMTPIGFIITAIAGLITYIVALRENWGGAADQAYKFSNSLRDQADKMGALSGMTKAYADMNDFLLKSIGALPPAEREAEEAQKKVNEEIANFKPKVQEATAALTGYGRTWQQVADDVLGYIGSVETAQSRYSDKLTAAIQETRQALAQDPTNEVLRDLQSTLEGIQAEVVHGFGAISEAANNSSKDFDARLQDMMNEASKLDTAFSDLPGPVQTYLQQFVDSLDAGIKKTGDFELTMKQAGQIVVGVTRAVGREMQGVKIDAIAEMVPAIKALPQPIQDVVTSMVNYVNATEDTNDNSQVTIALSQLLGDALNQVSSGAGQATDDVNSLTEAEKEQLATIQANAAAIGLMVTVTKDNAEGVKYMTDALTGLNAESILNYENNLKIVDTIKQWGQGFSEAQVGIAAQAEGLQTWRDAIVQNYTALVQQATALGYVGNASIKSAGDMLAHVKAQEALNDINQTAIDGYFSLNDAQIRSIDSSGALQEKLGQVQLGLANVTAEESATIAEQVKLNEANTDAVEAYNKLTEEQKKYLETLGVTPQVIQQVINGEITMSDAMIAAIASADEQTKALEKQKEAIAGLSPAVQEYARSLGLANQTAEQMSEVNEAVFKHVQDLDSGLQSARQKAVDFAAANGQLGEVVNMSDLELIEFVATMDASVTSAEDAADKQAEAAKKIADAWEQELQRAVEAWNTSSEAFASAASDISDEIGDAGAEGAIKFTDEFLTEFVPKQVVEEAFDKNIDVEDLIDDIKGKAEDAMKDGLISDVAMKDAIQPMIKEMENIPGETEKSMGEMIAVARNAMTNLKPVISGGIHEVGRDAMGSIKTQLLDPMTTALESGAGTAVWDPLVTNFKRVVNQLPPEYDRLKGDWLKTLELAGSDTRSQVNAIMAILGEISPEWKAQIDQMDKDGDGIKDLFDNDVTNPINQMKRAILEAFQIIFLALGRIEEANFLQPFIADLQNAKTAAVDAAKPFNDVADSVSNQAKAAGLATGPTAEYMKWFQNQSPEIQADARELYNLATAQGDTGSAASSAAPEVVTLDDAIASAAWNSGEAAKGTKAMNDMLAQTETDANNAAAALDTYLDKIAPLGAMTQGGLRQEAEAEGGPLADKNFFAEPAAAAAAAPAPAQDPGALIDPYVSKLNELSEKAKEVIPGIELMWTNHFTNTSAQLNTFITGPMTTLAAAYVLYQTNVIPILAAMELAWTNHLTNNGAQIQTFVAGPLTLLSQAYLLYQTNVIPILQGMELAWTNHLVNNGTQITEFVAGPLTLLSEAYMLYQTNVIPILAAMELAWTNHLINNGAQITEFVSGPLVLLGEAYTLFQENIIPIVAGMELAWTNHLANNGAQIGEFVSGPMANYAVATVALAGSIHAALETANQHWAAHAEHVGGMADEAAKHVEQMGRKIVATMNKISAAMGQAEAAAHRLANAIDALHDKEITVTTHFVTTGAAPKAGGMNQVVRGPQLLLVGEAGPEHVKITPLSGASTSANGIAPGRSGVIAAAKGMETIVGEKLDAQAISNFVGERGMRLDDFKESEEGKQIDVEVRRVYKQGGWIDKDEWKDFAKEYGYRISDFDKKKNGKLADIMFKRMKGVKFQEEDDDFGGGPEAPRKRVDWGTTRGHPANLDEGGPEGPAVTGFAGTASSPTRTGRGGGGGGSRATIGGGGFNTRADGTAIVYTKLDLHVEVDKRELAKLQRELETAGYMTTK